MLQRNYSYPDSQHMCDVCSEAVTNPLCPFCLAEEIKVWLTFYPSLSKELMPKINKYLSKINNRITSYGTHCIKCKKDRASVCPYCFTEFVFDELQELNAGKYVLKEFMDFFNFDSDHTGYTREAEEIGIV